MPDSTCSFYALAETFLPQDDAWCPDCCPSSVLLRRWRQQHSRQHQQLCKLSRHPQQKRKELLGTRSRGVAGGRAQAAWRPPTCPFPGWLSSRSSSPTLTRTARDRLCDTRMATMPAVMLCRERSSFSRRLGWGQVPPPRPRGPTFVPVPAPPLSPATRRPRTRRWPPRTQG